MNTVKLEDIGKVLFKGTPLQHNLVLPSPMVSVYDGVIQQWVEYPYFTLDKIALGFYDVVIDESCDAPYLTLKTIANPLPFDEGAQV